MLDILLVVQMVIAFLLITLILMQKSSVDGTSGLSSGSSMTGGGVFTAQSAANFFTRSTVILAFLFMVNAVALANLSGKKASPEKLLEKTLQKSEVPIAN